MSLSKPNNCYTEQLNYVLNEILIFLTKNESDLLTVRLYQSYGMNEYYCYTCYISVLCLSLNMTLNFQMMKVNTMIIITIKLFITPKIVIVIVEMKLEIIIIIEIVYFSSINDKLH
jgi:hypothetical protein